MSQYTVASTPVIILAPAQEVWDILLDFDRYPEWNPFTWRIDTSLIPGDPVDLHVHLGPWKIRQREQVREVTPPSTLRWGMHMITPGLLAAERTQRLEILDEHSCCYTSEDAFSGLLTPVVTRLFGSAIREGFNRMALALKERAEQPYSVGNKTCHDTTKQEIP